MKPTPLKGKVVRIIDYEGKEHIVIPLDRAKSAVEWLKEKLHDEMTSVIHDAIDQAFPDVKEKKDPEAVGKLWGIGKGIFKKRKEIFED